MSVILYSVISAWMFVKGGCAFYATHVFWQKLIIWSNLCPLKQKTCSTLCYKSVPILHNFLCRSLSTIKPYCVMQEGDIMIISYALTRVCYCFITVSQSRKVLKCNHIPCWTTIEFGNFGCLCTISKCTPNTLTLADINRIQELAYSEFNLTSLKTTKWFCLGKHSYQL